MKKYLDIEAEKRLANTVYYNDGGEVSAFDWGNETRTGNISSGLNIAGSAVDVLDNNEDYDNADVLSSTLKYTAMGATAGPVGAAVGAAVGLGVGLVQKKRFQKEQKRQAYEKEQSEGFALAMKDKEQFAGYAHGGEIKDSDKKASLNILDLQEDYDKRGYGRTWIGPPIKEKEVNYVKPEVAVEAAKKMDLTPSMPNISSRQDNTNLGINYSQRGVDAKKSFMDKWNLKEGQFNTVDFHTKEGNLREYNTGGMTKGAYSHSTNPLTVVDKNGNNTGMELTGGEGVFDKPFMDQLKGMLSSGNYQEAGKAVQSEMKTWKHK
jgi:hypothetical protein